MRVAGWRWVPLVIGLVVSAGVGAIAAGPTRAQDEEPAVELPEVVVRAPSPYAPPGAPAASDAVTPLRRVQQLYDVPQAVTVQEGDYLRRRRMVRSLPDALRHLPGVQVQKTAPMQASPFIRGFTGYRNLMLVDGVRLNHAGMRSGPNQYWSTIDSYTVDRLELVRGPLSVLYGSDAVGGTVNVLPRRRQHFHCGLFTNGLVSTRAASAERALFGRLELEGNRDGFGWLGGVTGRHMGDLVSGGGKLPRTGDIEELDFDLRFDLRLGRDWTLVLAGQHVGIRDAPRTHKTVFSVPFHGTTVGSELRRDYDQDRDLVYARLDYDPSCGPVSAAHVGVSWHHHREERDRLRTNDRQDLSGFDLHQLGVRFQVETPTGVGLLTWGGDWYHDEADTWRRNFRNGALDSAAIQGPFGDDSRYDLGGLFLQDQLTFGCLDVVLGGRFTYARADAERVEDPLNPGSVIRVDGEWTNVVGSLSGLYHVTREWNAYASVAQSFRAPTLYDLTSFDVTGFVDTPAPGLQPEDYVSFEAGVKTEQRCLSGSAAAWYTVLDDTIVRSPTGQVFENTPVVRADNVGDGFLWGLEADAAWQLHPLFVVFGNASYMEGEADELDPATGALVRSPVSRMKPFTATLGLRLEPPHSPWWLQLDGTWAAREDRLSLRDETDTSRIPPGGTPGWALLNLRLGWDVSRSVYLGLSLENLFDENYRVHGSGQNESGRSLVAVFEARF